MPNAEALKYNQAWHLFSVNIDFKKLKISRNKVMRLLENKGIGTQIHYIPLYKQPIYKNLLGQEYFGAEKYYSTTLSLPLYYNLSEKDVIYITNNLKKILYN